MLLADARDLYASGMFSADGLANTALSEADQKFSKQADRQTFKGDAWNQPVGDHSARQEFSDRMRSLRRELSVGLSRPTLALEGERTHEMTFNWYEPGASLGRHLDEHHEATKGQRAWTNPTRRSVVCALISTQTHPNLVDELTSRECDSSSADLACVLERRLGAIRGGGTPMLRT